MSFVRQSGQPPDHVDQRRADDRFALAEELSREAGDVLMTALVPGLEIPLSRMLRE